jgi:glutamate 5-kinase
MQYVFEDGGERKQALEGVRRLVIKVGTRLLMDMPGVHKSERVRQLVAEVARLRDLGIEVILVSSGAVGAGLSVLGTGKRPHSVPGLQAHAAVGQCRLMFLYEQACAEHGFHAGQLLLSADDLLRNRERHLNVTNCVNELLRNGVLPVVNENDSVSVDEIRVGDNDTLAALVATMLRADMTILLTTVDGMYVPSREGGEKPRLSVVSEVNDDTFSLASGTDGNPFSVGGMKTKIAAAEIVTRAGEPLWIADGRDFAVLRRILAGEDTGTLFTPRRSERMSGHKRFLAFFTEPVGDIVIDSGAVRAVREQGRSLLPGGIVDCRGNFGRGDTVRLVDADGVEIARGLANYSKAEVSRIQGVRTSEISALLGEDASFDEVVHRDYLVVTT